MSEQVDNVQSATATSGSTPLAAPANSASALGQGTLPGAVLMLGVGGMGMAPLAIYLAQAGVKVFGSDDSLQPRVRALLEAAGATLLDADAVAAGFAEGRFAKVELCAISSAISASHRLLALARSASLRILRRGELLAQVSGTRKLIAVVGSHGKTTTTGLIITALEKLGLTFDYVLGGLFQDKALPPARHLPQSQWLVAEVDESDGTIEHFAPYLTVAVNFDWDHTDRYASAAALRETFAALFARTKTEVIFPADDAVLAALVPPDKASACAISAEARVRGFNGYNESLARALAKKLLRMQAGREGVEDAELASASSASQASSSVAPHVSPETGTVQTQLKTGAGQRGSGAEAGQRQPESGAGQRHLEMATSQRCSEASVAHVPPQTGMSLQEVEAADCASLFNDFCGIFRRQEWLYRSASLQIVTDYAHHPREVAALLEYLRRLNPKGRLVAVFQPHRYTRTRQFAQDFAQVLAGGTDAFWLMPVYAASEAAFAEGRSEAITSALVASRAKVAQGDTTAALPPVDAASSAGASVSESDHSSHHASGKLQSSAGASVSESGRSEDSGDADSVEHGRAGRSGTAAAQVIATTATPPSGSGGQASVFPAYAIATACREYLNVPIASAAAEAPTTLAFIGAGDIDALARKIAADCALREQWQRQLGAQTQVRLGEPLARRTTMRLGGSARFYADPGSVEDVGILMRLAREAGLPVWLLGRGSNLIVADEGYDGLVISFNSDAFRRIEPQADGTWYVGSGVALKRLCAQAAREGLSGWEFLDGIPGTVGGALRMNAGAMGKWIFDVVEAVDILLPDGTVERRPKAAFSIGYRRCSELAQGGVALGALLRPQVQVTVDAVRQRLDNYASRRKETQPREPSAGCIFKNPEGFHAGALIDELGLKGLRVGGAEVSAVHGNFIINRGEATAADVIELVRQIRAQVLEQRGIELEPEALLMGQRWQDVL